MSGPSIDNLKKIDARIPLDQLLLKGMEQTIIQAKLPLSASGSSQV